MTEKGIHQSTYRNCARLLCAIVSASSSSSKKSHGVLGLNPNRGQPPPPWLDSIPFLPSLKNIKLFLRRTFVIVLLPVPNFGCPGLVTRCGWDGGRMTL